jgi:hypothetical protein
MIIILKKICIDSTYEMLDTCMRDPEEESMNIW